MVERLNDNDGISFERSAIVVAHPDDEILWFSSILRRVAKTYICFSDYPPISELGERRRAAVGAMPLSNIELLNIVEADSFLCADWPTPRLSNYGFQIKKPRRVARQYERNHEDLKCILGEKLIGCATVFTHNPWGEYGHEDHGLVFAAVNSLQHELGFSLYFSSYVSQRNTSLLNTEASGLDAKFYTFPTDPPLAQQFEEAYRQHNCWTWLDGYEWPPEESFLRRRPEGQERVRAFNLPINFLCVDLPTKRPKDNVLKNESDRLRKKIARNISKVLGLEKKAGN